MMHLVVSDWQGKIQVTVARADSPRKASELARIPLTDGEANLSVNALRSLYASGNLSAQAVATRKS